MHHITCPTCGHHVGFQDEHVGKTATCPKCRHPFRLSIEDRNTVVPPPPPPPRPLANRPAPPSSIEPITKLMVLMFTDLAGSVDLKTRLGAPVYARLISRHDAIFKQVMAAIPDSQTIKDTGDGFLARFQTASDAVRAALCFQYALQKEQWDPEPVGVRIGLHLGQVAELEKEAATGLPKLVGLAADIAARIMDLATPGQILMTRTLFDDARQYLREHPPVQGVAGPMPEMKWMAHGPYLFKGSDEPMDVFEVGATGIAPLTEPPDSAKARRAVRPGEESLFGWRPAIGLVVPGRDGWVLQQKLGEGGFGEVWLAQQQRTRDARVFKFCFDADRLRSFKREMTLFRLMREALGDRRDIARLWEVRLDKPPYYLESAFTREGDLANWSQRIGGITKLPLESRLELLAAIADAAAAAHSVGVLHKDIKPGNVLIELDADGTPRPLLADFGIGMITDPSQLAGRNITMTGFTETVIGNESSRTGTRMYSPPELLVGKPFTTKGDVYALGVMLYQLVVGDLTRPLAHGWERDIQDPVLREDIGSAVAGDESRRIPSAAQLADRLRSLPQRRAERNRQRRMRMTAIATTVLAVFLAVAVGLIWRERGLRDDADQQRRLAQEQKRVADEQRGTAEANRILAEQQRGIAELAQSKSEKQREEIATLLSENQNRLIRLYIEKGWQNEGGDFRKALLWFTEALRLEQGDEAAQHVHRLRIASVMHHLPRVEHQFVLPRDALVDISRDGQFALAQFDHENLVIWNVMDGTHVKLDAPDNFESLAFLRGGQLLGRAGQTIGMWSARTGRQLFTVPGAPGDADFLGRPEGWIDVDPTEKRFILANPAGGAQIWNVADGKPVSSVFGAGAKFNFVRLSAGGLRVLTDDGKQAKLWDATGTPMGEAMPHAWEADLLVLSPDGTKAAASDFETVHLWDTLTGKPLCAPIEHADPIRTLKFDSGSKTLATATTIGSAFLLEAATGVRRGSEMVFGQGISDVNVQFSDDGSLLATQSGDFNVRIWNTTTTRQVLIPLMQRSSDWGRHLRWIDSRKLLVADNDGLIRHWNIDGVGQVQTRLMPFTARTPSHTMTPLPDNLAPDETVTLSFIPRQMMVATNADSSRVLTAAADGAVRIWDSTTGRITVPAIAHAQRIQALAFAAEGRRFLTVDVAGTIRFFETATGRLLLTAAAGPVMDAMVSADGRRLVTVGIKDPAGSIHTVKLWDTTGLSLIASEMNWPIAPRPTFDAQGKRLLLLGDKTLHVFDATTLAPIGDAIAAPGFVHKAEFADNGQLLAFEYDEEAPHGTLLDNRASTAAIWNFDTGRIESTFVKPEHMRHGSRFDAKGERIALASADTVRIWDMKTGKPLTAPMMTAEPVARIRFSHDGKLIATATASGGGAVGFGRGPSRNQPLSGMACVWDAATGERISPSVVFDDHLADAQFTADNRRLMITIADELLFWNLLPDSRAVTDLVKMAQIQASAAIDSTGSVEPLDAQAQRRLEDIFHRPPQKQSAGQ